MDENEAVWLHSRRSVTLVEVSQASGLAFETVEELVSCGILQCTAQGEGGPLVPSDRLPALRAAARLCADLELEASALAVVLALLERIERLEAEAEALRAREARPAP